MAGESNVEMGHQKAEFISHADTLLATHVARYSNTRSRSR